MRTSDPSRSAQLLVPRMLESYPRTAPFCSRSSALPLAKFSFGAMSKRKTSPSSSFAQSRASSPPMFPAPMRPIFLRVGMADSLAREGPNRKALIPKSASHVRDEVVPELGALDLGRAVHEPREIVRDPLARD